MGKRIVITGLGAISSIGTGKDTFWDSAVSGKCGTGPLKAFDTSDFRVHIAAEVNDFKPDHYFDKDYISTFGKEAQFALASTKMAFDDAGLSPDEFDPTRISVVMGTLLGEMRLVEENVKKAAHKGVESIDPESVYQYPWKCVSQTISSTFNFNGHCETIYCACSSGNVAVQRACDLIEMGISDLVIAGGVDIIDWPLFTFFHDTKILAKEMCQPFDKNRKGLVCGEGAGVILVQSLESAEHLGQHIYAEVLGYAQSCDAYHISSPAPDGRGICKSMKMALSDALINPEEIDYLSAHGTGTKANDKIETMAIKEVFGSHAMDLKLSSIKSMIGHSMGAASALETIACCLMIKKHLILPTINYNEPDPNCDLDYVPNTAIEYPVNICMNNSIGFGGINASLILGRCLQ